MTTSFTETSIREAQRSFTKVYQAFFEQWPSQYERIQYAKRACGHDWIGSHSCGVESNHSCVNTWASDSEKIYKMGPQFYVALDCWNRLAAQEGFQPILNAGNEELPSPPELWGAFHGLGDHIFIEFIHTVSTDS